MLRLTPRQRKVKEACHAVITSDELSLTVLTFPQTTTITLPINSGHRLTVTAGGQFMKGHNGMTIEQELKSETDAHALPDTGQPGYNAVLGAFQRRIHALEQDNVKLKSAQGVHLIIIALFAIVLLVLAFRG